MQFLIYLSEHKVITFIITIAGISLYEFIKKEACKNC